MGYFYCCFSCLGWGAITHRIHGFVNFKIIEEQEKLEDELSLKQQIHRAKIFAKKRQRIHLMAELVERTNVPTAKQERAAWKPGGNQEKKHSSVIFVMLNMKQNLVYMGMFLLFMSEDLNVNHAKKVFQVMLN